MQKLPLQFLQDLNVHAQLANINSLVFVLLVILAALHVMEGHPNSVIVAILDICLTVWNVFCAMLDAHFVTELDMMSAANAQIATGWWAITLVFHIVLQHW